MKNKRENYEPAELMQHRRIQLGDGRYLIFYNFNESLSVNSNDAAEKLILQPENKGAAEDEEENV